MKKISVSVSYDEEKLSTIKLYLEPKGIHVEVCLSNENVSKRAPKK